MFTIYSVYRSRQRGDRLSNVCAPTLQMVSTGETIPHVQDRMRYTCCFVSLPLGCYHSTRNSTVSTHAMHQTPLEKVVRRPGFAIEASAQVAVDQIRTLDTLKDMASTSSPFISSVGSPTAPVLPIYTQDRLITPVGHESTRAHVRERTSIRRDSDVTPKPMRPLASFFNEFIQNIRNVTVPQDQTSVSDKHVVFKRPLRKTSRNGESVSFRLDHWTFKLLHPLSCLEHYSRQCHVFGQLATNLTDITEGIFTSQSWTNSLDSIRQNDPDYRDHMNRQTPNLACNRHFSPDILAALEPQNYQVILSSPS